MPQREYDIAIGPDGSVELHIHGYQGKACLAAVQVFEEIVGELKDHRPTSAFYEPDEAVRQNLDQRT